MTTTENRHDKLLLTPKQAAEALAISERTLFARTASREIRAVRIGRCKRYALDDLRAAIELMKDVQG